jgi:uncharacterized repeat protein (TIGR03803 family)
MSGVKKNVVVGLTTAKMLRVLFASTLLVLAGRTFNASGQTETNPYSFPGYPNDGANPYAGLVQGSDGNFYGMTRAGGTNNYGTVFRISPSGSETNLHSFGGPLDGLTPFAGLIQASDGNFYGTTDGGGTNGDGTVFRISPVGAYTSLYSFVGYPSDGSYPQAGLVQGSDSNFYATTKEGGMNSRGTIFRITPSGTETTLYSFGSSPNDGNFPEAGLVRGSDGNLYGTTDGGGTNPCQCGTVFRISPSGSYSNLYSFGGPFYGGGSLPQAALVQGSDGNFYGTTVTGGTNGGMNLNGATIFRISPSGSYTMLHSFAGSPNGNGPPSPQAGLVQGSDGNFYGTTPTGGTNNEGTVFRISPSGSYTILYSFGNYTGDGADPGAAPVQGSDGNFYGTTVAGGTNGYGIVYKLTVPLSPPANQISGVQFSGSDIVFSIPSVAYETYQLQFSSSMNPTNWVNEGGTITSIGALLTLTNFGGANQPQGFYRFAITP